MTKDRARKRATRQRAALTGERYVVAQRSVGESQPSTSGRLHALTHRVPRVPAHVDGGLQRRAPRRRTANPARRHQASHGEPRVLVAWQNWIARRLGAGTR